MNEQQQQRRVLWAKAMDALARREHSAHELRRKLSAKRDPSPDILNEVLDALIRDDLLSDERFAQMLCRSRFNRGVGPVRIEYELNQHQIRADWIQQAMAEYQHRWVEQLQALRSRKFGDLPPPDYPAWARQAKYFQGKGFTTTQIQQAIPRRGH